MRDKNRIRPFLDEFEQLWLQNPDLRFGQIIALIMNVLDRDDLFFPEEIEIKNAIQKLMK